MPHEAAAIGLDSTTGNVKLVFWKYRLCTMYNLSFMAKPHFALLFSSDETTAQEEEEAAANTPVTTIPTRSWLLSLYKASSLPGISILLHARGKIIKKYYNNNIH